VVGWGRSQDGSATGFGKIIITVPPRVRDVMMFENLARHGGGGLSDCRVGTTRGPQDFPLTIRASKVDFDNLVREFLGLFSGVHVGAPVPFDGVVAGSNGGLGEDSLA